VDQLDKVILMELRQNCRVSYRAIARKLGVTFKTVRKRVDNLIETGVIRRFWVAPSLAMMDAEVLYAFLSTDGSIRPGELLNRVGEHIMVVNGSVQFNGDIRCGAYYVGSNGLAELGKFLRSQPSVTRVELHTLLTARGVKCELTQSDIKVLQCLYHDGRMSIVDIARHTKLTPKRVRKILDKLVPEGGGRFATQIHGQAVGDSYTAKHCFSAGISWRLNLADMTMCIIRVEHDDEKASYFEIAETMKRDFEQEYFYSYASASAPVSFHLFLFDHPRLAEPILSKIRKFPHLTHVKPLFSFEKRSYRHYGHEWMENLFREAKLPSLTL
jgi:DNA-binding Lrp family transcriptional regulator